MENKIVSAKQIVYAGQIKVAEKMPIDIVNYINCFSAIRHVKRDNKKLKEIHPDWAEHVFDYRLGTQGEYYVPINEPNEKDNYDDKSIVDFDNPPDTQPGLWCPWVLGGERTFEGLENAIIEWGQWEQEMSGYEDFKWMKYMIDKFLKVKGYVCNGIISGIGENDTGHFIIAIENNIYYYETQLEKGLQEGDLKFRIFEYIAAKTNGTPKESMLKEMVGMINENVLSYERLLKKREEWRSLL